MTIPQFEAPQIGDLQDLLPAYEVLDFIAKGGMGAVYRARQISLDREVAIKILPREFGEDDEFRRSFGAEARAMAKLNHPNLIGVYDFGEVEGMPYIVMEYVNGKALHYSSHGICIDPTEAAQLTLGICEGLAHAHEAGILHRDIKPANILLDARKQPKVGDFGLAYAIGSDEGGELLFGTPGYSAPEVINNPGKVAKQSDVFSIGVLFYELLTGELPGEPYVAVTQKAAVDPRFDQLIRRAINPCPGLRFSDAGAMAAEMSQLLKSQPKAPAATIMTKRLIPGGTPVVSRRAASPVPRLAVTGPGSNWPLWRNLAIIAVLLVAIFGVAGATKRKKAANTELKREQPLPIEPAPWFPPVEPKDKPLPNRDKPVDNPTEQTSETPLAALARLQDPLSHGKRTLFPPQTFERGEFRYFFVETPMTWQEAAAFAEAHGGHLATVRSDTEADWLSNKSPADTVIWLGGGPAGSGAWGWVDGSDWTLPMPRTASGIAAALSALGTLQTNPVGERHPFFIQWNMDGENPGCLQAQLQRTKESRGNPNPTYPPGTLPLGSRRYLIVTRPVTWDEAAALAAGSDGHLAVPSDQAENDFLQRELSSALGDASACWIGSRSDGDSFTWITAEPWSYAAWAPDFPKPDAPTGSVVRFLTGAGGGWQHLDAHDTAGTRAFVIEWSDDHIVTSSADATGVAGKLEELQDSARAELNRLRKIHREEVRKNTKDLEFELGGWSRRQPRSEATRWGPGILKVVECIDSEGRFTWSQRPPALPADLQRLVKACTDRQASLDDELRSKLEAFRNAYLSALNTAHKKLFAAGLKGEVRAIDNEMDACGDLDKFLRHFDSESLPEPVDPNDPVAADPFEDWVQTVGFQAPSGIRLITDGTFIMQIGPNGQRMKGFKQTVRIDGDQQIVHWKFGGKNASLSVDADRMTGVWTMTSGKEHSVTVVPSP